MIALLISHKRTPITSNSARRVARNCAMPWDTVTEGPGLLLWQNAFLSTCQNRYLDRCSWRWFTRGQTPYLGCSEPFRGGGGSYFCAFSRCFCGSWLWWWLFECVFGCCPFASRARCCVRLRCTSPLHEFAVCWRQFFPSSQGLPQNCAQRCCVSQYHPE